MSAETAPDAQHRVRRSGFLRHLTGERYNHSARGMLTIPVVDLSGQPRAGAMCAPGSQRKIPIYPPTAMVNGERETAIGKHHQPRRVPNSRAPIRF